MEQSSEAGAAVIPVTGSIAGSGASAADPWQLLGDNSGMLVGWEPFSGSHDRWGSALSAGSGLANQLLAVVDRAGGTLSNSAETLFRLELPAGRALSDLVPALGGGFRGFTRGAEGTITSQARLQPVSGAAVGGVVGIALGPLLGLMVVSVGADMLAKRQQDAKLDAIKHGVDSLVKNELERLVAGLKAASHALREATWAILDQIVVPQAVGLGATVGTLKTTKFLVLEWLAGWEAVSAQAAKHHKGVDYGKLKQALGKVAIGGFDAFGLHVQLAGRALALDSRAHVVALAEARIAHPEGTVENFYRNVQGQLAENVAHLERLRKVLWQFAELRLTIGRAMPGSWNHPTELQRRLVRLARAVSEPLPPLPVLTADNRLAIEALRHLDGSVSVLAPRESVAVA